MEISKGKPKEPNITIGNSKYWLYIKDIDDNRADLIFYYKESAYIGLRLWRREYDVIDGDTIDVPISYIFSDINYKYRNSLLSNMLWAIDHTNPSIVNSTLKDAYTTLSLINQLHYDIGDYDFLLEFADTLR